MGYFSTVNSSLKSHFTMAEMTNITELYGLCTINSLFFCLPFSNKKVHLCGFTEQDSLVQVQTFCLKIYPLYVIIIYFVSLEFYYYIAYYFKPGIAIKHILLSTSRHCSVAEDPMQKQSKMINIVKPKNIGSRTLDYIHERPAYRRSHFGSPCLQMARSIQRLWIYVWI